MAFQEVGKWPIGGCSEVGCVKTKLTVGLNDTKSSATNKQKTATDRSCRQFLTMESEGAEDEMGRPCG